MDACLHRALSTRTKTRCVCKKTAKWKMRHEPWSVGAGVALPRQMLWHSKLYGQMSRRPPRDEGRKRASGDHPMCKAPIKHNALKHQRMAHFRVA